MADRSDHMHLSSEKNDVTVNSPYGAGPASHASSDGGSHSDTDSIRTASPGIERIQTRTSRLSEKSNTRASRDLRKTASNVLSNVVSRLSTRIRDEPPPPPDGGARAWVQVACGFLVIFTTWGYVNAFGAFQSYYTGILPVSASAISWIGSVQIFLSLSLGVVTGRLLDAGFFFPTYIVGATIQVLGVFLMSISTKYWQLMLTQGVLTGLGNGIFFTPTLALVTTYFDKRRGIAVGLVTTGNSLGGAIYPVIARQLLPEIGFAWTARVLGFINLAVLCVALAFLKPRLPPRKSGAIVDLSALRDPVFLGFAFAIFFAMWANYYIFYYVSNLFPAKVSPICLPSEVDLRLKLDRLLWPRNPRAVLLRVLDSHHNYQCGRYPHETYSPTDCRSHRPPQCPAPDSVHMVHCDVLLACRERRDRILHLLVLLRGCVWCNPISNPYQPC